MIGFSSSTGDVSACAYPINVPALYRQGSVAEGRPLMNFGGAGTGGTEGGNFLISRNGYRAIYVIVIKSETPPPQTSYAPYADIMKEVQNGFGRTMSQLPAVFGVSRQTLYNWLKGEEPKEHHHDKLKQLAAAARVFAEESVKLTTLSLDRTVAQGKSFVELLGEGADGEETAQQLVRIMKRGAAERAKLDALLGDRTPLRPDVSEMGRPALNENA